MKRIPKGQMDLFEFMAQSIETPEVEETVTLVQNLFAENEHVFQVKKGSVFEFIVSNETWDTKKSGTGYRVCDTNHRMHGCIWDKNLGVDVFKSKEEAEKVAREYLSDKDYIPIDQMKIVSFEAYAYTRNCDHRPMFSFWCELENGMLYKKDFCTYHHLVLPQNKKKALKAFYNQAEFANNDIKQIPYVPFFKPMYRVVAESSSSGWDYAEADFSGATGYLQKEKEHE